MKKCTFRKVFRSRMPCLAQNRHSVRFFGGKSGMSGFPAWRKGHATSRSICVRVRWVWTLIKKVIIFEIAVRLWTLYDIKYEEEMCTYPHEWLVVLSRVEYLPWSIFGILWMSIEGLVLFLSLSLGLKKSLTSNKNWTQ